LGQIEVQRLEWYDDTYDKGEKGLGDVLELPGETSVLEVAALAGGDVVARDWKTGTVLHGRLQ